MKAEREPWDNEEDVLRYEESALYEEKIRRLEDSIGALRLSRRVLMSLLEQSQEADRQEMARLTRENARLRQQLLAISRRLWQQNSLLASQPQAPKQNTE